jgi:hypothetical protein
MNSEVSENKKDFKQTKSAKTRLFFAGQLQVYDMLLKQDLEMIDDDSFMIFARPAGTRCLVTSSQGKTVARN